MSKKRVSEKERRFPWKEPKMWKYGSGGGGLIGPAPRWPDALNARLIHGIGAVGFLLFGCIALLVDSSEPGLQFVGIVFVVIGLITGGEAVYAHFSLREEEKQKAEHKAHRDEKQRLWREKRRKVRKAQKRK